MVVPGSGQVKRQAEQEGLDKVFREAGFDWREAGCSMCLAMNPDRLERANAALRLAIAISKAVRVKVVARTSCHQPWLPQLRSKVTSPIFVNGITKADRKKQIEQENVVLRFPVSR